MQAASATYLAPPLQLQLVAGELLRLLRLLRLLLLRLGLGRLLPRSSLCSMPAATR